MHAVAVDGRIFLRTLRHVQPILVGLWIYDGCAKAAARNLHQAAFTPLMN
ncbi:MAG: hypothetical protein QOJ54_3465 [Aliidongia sp.]|jgi:hypothetical protein|nr:hypothetical protein [Aliidongia sp.]